MWKEWRKEVPEEPGAKLFPGEETRESPGHSNLLLNDGKIPEKLGGEELECIRAYQKIQKESTAQCKAGPHNHLKNEAPEDPVDQGKQEERKRRMLDEEDDEKIKMEIMLGMTQEEGPPCLLCLLPRCICHLTLDIAKLEYKITELRTMGRKEQTKEENLTKEHRAEGDLGALLEGGGLTHNKGGVKPSGEGSSPPPGACGEPGS